MFSFLDFLIERATNDSDQESTTVDVYHGSGVRFNKFERSKARIHNDYMGGGVGYFTTDHGIAKQYAKHMAKHYSTDTPFIYHATIKMNKVFDVDRPFAGEKLKNVLPDEKHHENFARGAGLLRAGADKDDILSKLKSGNLKLTGHQVFQGLSQGGVKSRDARDHLIKKGYDGLRYNGGQNTDDRYVKHDVYIPYKADSIRINKVTKIVKKSNEEV